MFFSFFLFILKKHASQKSRKEGNLSALLRSEKR